MPKARTRTGPTSVKAQKPKPGSAQAGPIQGPKDAAHTDSVAEGKNAAHKAMAPASLADIEKNFVTALKQASNAQELASVRQDFFGKKSALALALRNLGGLAAEDRRQQADDVNTRRDRMAICLKDKEKRIRDASRIAQDKQAAVDVTLPGRRRLRGAEHPIKQVEKRIVEALSTLGFEAVDGPLIEEDWYNFEALNIASDHPARDMHDTFFVTPDVVLRTHTSNVQVRTMMTHKPPVRIVAPGMTFRRDEVDATHSPVFHQLEGLWIDERATLADLKGTLCFLLSELFGAEHKVRFRPSFFPFTEPSCEVDLGCISCKKNTQDQCRVCRGTGWLEVMGAGMVDPAVLKAVGYDSERVQGFAFGMGLERIAMLGFGIDDIRLLYDNDLRLLRQFAPQLKQDVVASP